MIKNLFFCLFAITSVLSCTTPNKESNAETEIISTATHELHKAIDSEAVLVIFPGAGATMEETKASFSILEAATDHKISVLLMNFNRRLWIKNTDAKQLATEIITVFEQHNLKSDKVYIGGMSIGGNIALTLSNYLHQNDLRVAPKGVFIVDSPIDLYALYESSVKDVNNPDLSEERLAEPKMLISYFEGEFGKEKNLLTNIQKVSPFTLETNTINVKYLKTSKLRLYTEPDTLWLKENRQVDFESTNAYSIQKILQLLQQKNWTKSQLIETKNKGYRANGERNPHSWSIVDVQELIEWMKE